MKKKAIKVATIAAVMTLTSHEMESQNAWTQKANFGGTGRYGAVGFSIGNKGYIGTGWDGSTYYHDFSEYDPGTNVWAQKANFGGESKMEKSNNEPFSNWSLMNRNYKRGGGGDLKTYGQLGVLTSTNFKGNPAIGPILSIEKGESFAFGANLGFLYYLNSGSTAFRIPINGFARYYVSGDREGFFPEASFGLDYFRFTIKGIISISVSSTNPALSLGGGFKSGNLIIGANYYMILSSISVNAFLFKLGLAF